MVNELFNGFLWLFRNYNLMWNGGKLRMFKICAYAESAFRLDYIRKFGLIEMGILLNISWYKYSSRVFCLKIGLREFIHALH